jgi:chromosome segregation protein
VQFNRLRLSGFKSFVDAAELEIASGLTGVVGPNGCGKSNLVEALRWVMGETSAKRMRGGEMDDVIFGGSSVRPARNVAEVALFVDNSDRTVPAELNDAPELNITRRIERTKGSSYRVNGREVRGRDVQLLFADAGTGARSAGIVNQGRIGAIINAKPSERRIILEEAANIRGLHTRRHEAELRLKAAEANLERLEDVVNALRTQLNGLRQQVRQAVRYRSVSEKIRKAESVLFHGRWQEQMAKRLVKETILRDAEAAVGEATGQAARESARQADLTAKLPALRHAEAEASAGLQRLALAQGELDSEQQRIVTARSEAKSRLRQIDEDVERETALAAEARESAGRLGTEWATIEKAKEGEQEREAVATTRLAEANTLAAQVEAQISALTEVIATTEARRAVLQRQVRMTIERHDRLQQQLEGLDHLHQELKESTVAPSEVAAADQAVKNAGARMEAARVAVDITEKQKGECAAQVEAVWDALRELEAVADKFDAEAGALRDILSADTSSRMAPVLDQITVETGYENALGASLGDDLTAPVGAGVGATEPRYWTGAGTEEVNPQDSISAFPAGIVALDQMVRGPAQLTRRLAQIGVASDPGEALRLQAGLAQGQRLTSLEGGLWRWDGFVVAVDAPSAAAVQMRQRNRLIDIEARRQAVAGDLAAAQGRVLVKRDALAGLSEREKQTQVDQREAMGAVDGARKHHGALLGRLVELESKLRGIEESRLRLQADRAEAVEQRGQDERELVGLDDVEALRAESDGHRRTLGERRAELTDARSDRDQLLREVQRRRTRLRAIVAEQSTWSDRVERATVRMRELDERRKLEAGELGRLAARPSQIGEQRAKLVVAIEQAEAKRWAATDNLAAAEGALGQVDHASRDADRSVAAVRENRVRAESELSQVNQVLSALRERVSERLDCLPDQILEKAGIGADEDLPDIDPTKAQLERLTHERERIGAVNLRAEQEVEELGRQIEGMESEREDLVGAIVRLRRAIASLNREGRERLLVAFEKVNGHFQDLFVRLFGGGRAHLTLVEADDPLDAGLEIMASPPGKKLQMLSLLSGGEQALTATALVFAAFLTNPAAVCVLDEVDAPLDDSNVDRFCNLLQDISRTTGTRFLIITHHRLTMARMDRLFGVTMAEQGVSQLVSVDLEGAQKLREPA